MDTSYDLNPQDALMSAYAERNMCVTLIVRMAQALGLEVGVKYEDDEENGASEEWPLVFVELPTGQVSWHVHRDQARWLPYLPLYQKPWDKHNLVTKYNRVVNPGQFQKGK